MNKIYCDDMATLAFQPFIDLTPSAFANLSSQAPLHWLNSDFSSCQWGAFMHFYGPTRRLLKIGGLNLEDENFLNIHLPHPRWDFLTSGYSKGDLEIKEQIFFVRLLFYLGFYNQGVELCKKSIQECETLEQHLWVSYLQQLGNSLCDPSNWSPIDLIREMDSMKIKTTCSPFLYFHIFLLLAKFYIRNDYDSNAAEKWLNKASLLTEDFANCTNDDINLARLRLDKYRGDLYFKRGEPQKAVLLLQNACNFSDLSISRLSKDSQYLYLFKETKRRLLDALTFYYDHCGNQKEAFKYAQQSVYIDPYCSYALLLAGKTAVNIDRELSKRYFEQAAEYGILERPYVKRALVTLFQTEFPLRMQDLQMEALDGGLFLVPQKKPANATQDEYSNADSSPYLDVKLPIEVGALDEIANTHSEDIDWEKIKTKPVYLRSLPFWELKLSNFKTPMFCLEPLIALEIFKNKELPWSKTLYLQRAMPLNFREELIFAVAPHALFAICHQSKAGKLEILQNRSEWSDKIFSTYQTISNLPKLERILFCRLLGALGFYEEALKGLPLPEKNSPWDIEDEYTFCTKLFFENIYFIGGDPFPYQDIEFAFEKLSLRAESLRMKLVLTMLGCVYHAKRNHVPSLKKWREKGFESLIKVQNSAHFDEFEKGLLTSRFYRAASFYPFLTQDRATLQKEAELCEFYGRSLKPQTEKEKLLYRENLFPMLESMARIFNFLGDPKRSLNLMEEIVYKIDDQDAKAWIQVGESREKNGDLRGALEAFQAAINLGIPLGGIACYRAGRTCEKLGDFNEAKSYYIRSLKFCPKGLSPLRRLNAISKELGDGYLKNWSEASLNNLLALKAELFAF